MFSDIPAKYDRFLGPLFFQPYARFASEQISGDARLVLDLACGTGIFSQALRTRSPSVQIVGLDSSSTMLQMALCKGLERFEAVRGNAESLPFRSGQFDAIICMFGLMFFNDQSKALAEVWRALRVAGVFVVSVWESIDANPVAQLANRVGREFYGVDPPPFFETPYSMSASLLEERLRVARFGQPHMMTVRLESDPISPRDASLGLLEGNPILRGIVKRGADRLPELRIQLERALELEFGNPIRAPMTAAVAVVSKSG